ncbi:MAG: hypothetical protein NZO58_00800, partial [Gemmataceae bacterium]|nr:hypothetical protein [Gemmataceae bacterium]
PAAPPGKYTLKLTVDGKVLTGTVEVRLDPRVRISDKELAEQHALALRLRDDITQLAKTVLALRFLRKQLLLWQEAWADDAKAQPLDAMAKKLRDRLDSLEANLHNPKAEVTYDILAMKGGAKLYSQLAHLYDVVKDGDGPVTQGMREVYEDLRREWTRLAELWREVQTDVQQFNDAARAAGFGVLGSRRF